MKDSKIEWTHHTFNPWWGCTKVSAGCAHCYAETFSKRTGHRIWGDDAERRFFGDKHWAEPLKWNKAAMEAGERHRVFCASMADVFEDRDDLNEQRVRLFDLICHTPQLDWLLLTKRPQNALEMMVRAGLYAVANPNLPRPQPNIWIGTSCENQEAADERIPHLLKCPAAIRFISAEPLLGAINLEHIGPEKWDVARGWKANASNERGWANTSRIDWIIVGGESGPGARACDAQWIRAIVVLCKDAELPVFVKQLGAKVVQRCSCCGRMAGNCPGGMVDACGPTHALLAAECLNVRSSKGGDIEEFPADLRVRQFPV